MGIAAPYGKEIHSSVLPALAWHISRVMLKIETVRERYHCGTKKARLYRDIAVERPDVARPVARRAALLRTLQLAQDVQGQVGEHAAQRTSLPPGLFAS